MLIFGAKIQMILIWKIAQKPLEALLKSLLPLGTLGISYQTKNNIGFRF